MEYALRGIPKPIGVSQWEASILKSLPKELAGILPTVEELEAELSAGRVAPPRAQRAKPER